MTLVGFIATAFDNIIVGGYNFIVFIAMTFQRHHFGVGSCDSITSEANAKVGNHKE